MPGPLFYQRFWNPAIIAIFITIGDLPWPGQEPVPGINFFFLLLITADRFE
jgi:hypothetical protein